MAYRLGFCPQCNIQITVNSPDGRVVGRTPIFREADLIFSDGSRVRTILCSNCLKNIDFEKLMSSILEEGSFISQSQREALTYKMAETVHDGQLTYIREPKGLPISIENRTL